MLLQGGQVVLKAQLLESLGHVLGCDRLLSPAGFSRLGSQQLSEDCTQELLQSLPFLQLASCYVTFPKRTDTAAPCMFGNEQGVDFCGSRAWGPFSVCQH